MDGNNPEERKNKIICKMTTNTTILTIEEATKEDAGLYVCEFTIEIPKLIKDTGDGTWLYVQDKVFVLDIRFFYLTLLLIIPILISGFCVYYKRKKKKELFLDHVYGNMKRNATRPSKKQNTPKKETKKKTSS
ncbi:immunoglobulin superfamily member 6-like [Engystomops pustulosus]|uniref:immunoglobulin superfamily member 6-like n=1 Tax=Engystomops pustulosus TaxID=76066 RepID=UPI003AFB0F17